MCITGCARDSSHRKYITDDTHPGVSALTATSLQSSASSPAPSQCGLTALRSCSFKQVEGGWVKPPPADVAVRKEATGGTASFVYNLRRQTDSTVTSTLIANVSWMLMYVKPRAKHVTPTLSLLFHSSPQGLRLFSHQAVTEGKTGPSLWAGQPCCTLFPLIPVSDPHPSNCGEQLPAGLTEQMCGSPLTEAFFNEKNRV